MLKKLGLPKISYNSITNYSKQTSQSKHLIAELATEQNYEAEKKPALFEQTNWKKNQFHTEWKKYISGIEPRTLGAKAST